MSAQNLGEFPGNSTSFYENGPERRVPSDGWGSRKLFMTPEESVSLLNTMLSAAGVTAQTPHRAWEVFKSYALVPIVCANDSLLFQLGDGSESSQGYFDFTREFELRGACGTEPVWYEQIHIEFIVPTPQRLNLGTISRWSTEYPNYPAFFQAVESLPAFQKAIRFSQFQLEVYHTGV